MANSDYQQPQNIRDIVGRMRTSEWLLPNIQRKFVWDKERICTLFDSIMQGYPIGTLMVWKVAAETARNYKFFTFLSDYQQRFRETCEECVLTGTTDHYAVIDGQQRLNSIYLGLIGSYAEKLPRKHWSSSYDESVQPREYLYLDISEKKDDKYNFEFISDAKLANIQDKWKWFRVGRILDFNVINDLDDDFPAEYSRNVDTSLIPAEHRNFAEKTIKRLYRKIFSDRIIHYYQEEIQDLDKVIEIFVRTNSGGVPLSFSDLVMSVTVSQWAESRDIIDNLVRLIYSDYQISIDRDFILKVCLVLFSQDVKFRVKNFDEKTNLINQIRNNFDKISAAIKDTCFFVKKLGINDSILRAKYALIPIVYYTYYNNFDIRNISKNKDNRRKIGIWLKLALLKGMFGGQPDSIFPKIREILSKNIGKEFPTKEIISEYEHTAKDINVDENYLYEKIANTQYGSSDAYLLLSLAIPMDIQLVYNVDHMHPKKLFGVKELKNSEFLKKDAELYDFYNNQLNWNTVGNLQLLNDAENKSKNGRELSVWLNENLMYDKDAYLIPKKDGNYLVEFNQFKEFILLRREKLVQAILETLKF